MCHYQTENWRDGQTKATQSYPMCHFAKHRLLEDWIHVERLNGTLLFCTLTCKQIWLHKSNKYKYEKRLWNTMYMIHSGTHVDNNFYNNNGNLKIWNNIFQLNWYLSEINKYDEADYNSKHVYEITEDKQDVFVKHGSPGSHQRQKSQSCIKLYSTWTPGARHFKEVRVTLGLSYSHSLVNVLQSSNEIYIN